jgi:hypothetical protein
MQFAPATHALHASLSAANGEFLGFVERTPECLDRRQFAALDTGEGLYGHALQPWPTFVDRRRVTAMAAACAGLTALVKAIGERLFQRDPARLAAFYGIGLPHATAIAAALGRPELLAGVIVRGDFLDSADGLKCTELNLGGNLGGWQTQLWAPRYLGVPVVARFLSERGVRCRSRETLRLFLRHALDTAGVAVGGGAPRGSFNLALVVAPDFPISPAMAAFLDAELRQVLAAFAPAVAGRVLLCREAELTERAGGLWLAEHRIDAISEQHPMTAGGAWLAGFARGAAHYFNGPLRLVLDDKRNLALLSSHLDSPLWSADERRLIAAHLPWTRLVHAGADRFADQEVSLPDLLAARRSRLVLKRGVGYGGADVYFGAAATANRWDELVRAALGEGGWVVQERVEMLPYVYQAGVYGCAPHDVVWGIFVLGSAYGGSFLRLLPQQRGDVVNTLNGATEGIVFEVD